MGAGGRPDLEYYAMSKRKQNKFYRIIDEASHAPPSPEAAAGGDLRDIISSITANRQYIYIDLAEDRGFKMMEECRESDSESEVEQVGGSYIASLANSSSDNRKSIAYLLKLREINRQKELTFRLIDHELKQSQLKLKKKKSIFLDEALAAHEKKGEKRLIYHGMDAGLLEKYKNSSELDSIDYEIKEREARLLNNYSTIATHRPALPQGQPEKHPKKRSLFPALANSINTISIE